jgi:hypothetical protein
MKPGDVIDLAGQKYTSNINHCDNFFAAQEMGQSCYSAFRVSRALIFSAYI